jgi:hypothetical protein
MWNLILFFIPSIYSYSSSTQIIRIIPFGTLTACTLQSLCANTSSSFHTKNTNNFSSSKSSTTPLLQPSTSINYLVKISKNNLSNLKLPPKTPSILNVLSGKHPSPFHPTPPTDPLFTIFYLLPTTPTPFLKPLIPLKTTLLTFRKPFHNPLKSTQTNLNPLQPINHLQPTFHLSNLPNPLISTVQIASLFIQALPNIQIRPKIKIKIRNKKN